MLRPRLATVTVKSGDTLWDLAHINLGDPQRWLDIWHINRDIILTEQQRRGLAGLMYPENYIFPGQILTLPPRR